MHKWQRLMLITATVILIAAMLSTLLFSMRAVNDQTRAACFDQLEYIAGAQAKAMRDSAHVDSAMLTTIASIIGSRENLTEEKLLASMNSFEKTASYVSYLEYLSEDGRLLHESGVYLSAPSLCFAEEAAAAPYISGRQSGIYAPEDFVVRSAVPVKHEGRVIGVLYAVISLENMNARYTVDIYGGKASIFLEDGDSGDFLLDTWHTKLGNFDQMGTRKMLSGFSYEKLRDDLKKGVSGYVGFVSETTGGNLYLCYAPVGVNHWNVIVSVEEDVAFAQAKSVNTMLSKAIFIEIIILLIYMAFVGFVMSAANRAIRRLGMEDQNTGLPNRVVYDVFVKTSREKHFQSVVCIFADVNGLHEMNNLHGHDAGDQMLRAVAGELKRAFANQRIFRIGGDEFIVFAETLDMEAVRTALDRIQDTLKIRNYSVSFGVARREDELGLERIISEADAEMLINKRLYYIKHSRRRS